MKKIIIRLLTLILVIAGVCFYKADRFNVSAAVGTVTAGDGFVSVGYDDLDNYIKDNGNVAPTAPSGYAAYIFAGWYQDAACEEVFKNISADTTLAYAKFVPANVLSVKVQLKADATTKSETTNMRLVTSVDGTNYQNVGFEVYFNGATDPITSDTRTVYERIVASPESGVDYNYSAKVVDVESEYFATVTLLNIHNTEEQSNFDKPFYIKPYWTTLDGTVVYGVSKYVTVNDGLNENNINIPVRVGSGFDETAATVTVAGSAPASTSVAYYDGTYAHLNIGVTNRASALKSLSVVNVTDGTVSGSAEYRNLDTKYDGTAASVDTSWYDVKGVNKKKYVIATSADLYGLAQLVNKPIYYFGNQTIYMIADIEVNKGRATESGWSTYEEDGTTAIVGATSHIWTPIGYEGKNFQGTFDGQGHTISGLNGKPTTTATEAYLGLFGAVGTKTLQGKLMNFRVTNSYFEERTTGTNYTGGVVGRINGSVDSVYSDAYIKAYTILTGGITGRIGIKDDTTGEKKFTNCWYNGMITMDGNTATYGGGIVGQLFSGTLTMQDCLVSGDIKIVNRTTAAEVFIGGLCGRAATSITMENCLNTGETSLVGSTVSLTSIGRVIGLITNSTAITVDAKNVYYTNVGIGPLKWYAGGNPVIKETPVEITESDIMGNCAYFNKILDYSDTGAWALVPTNSETGVAESTPVLKSFADLAGVEPALPEVVGNIDWYTGLDQTNFVICDNEDNAANVEELKGFAYLVNEGISFDERTVKMANNVSISGKYSDWDVDNQVYRSTGEELTSWTPIGTERKGFAGTFDGQYNTISGLFIKTAERGAGLFKYTTEGSTIQNLKLVDSYIWSTSTDNTNGAILGSIVGSCGGNLTDVYSSAYVRANVLYFGGIAGQLHGTEEMVLDGCWFAGNVAGRSSSSNAGGIVGLISGGTVTMRDCLNSGLVTVGRTAAGGFFGRTLNKSDRWALSGSSTTSITIENCLATGVVSGNKDIGSAIGFHQKGTVTIPEGSVAYATTNSTAATEGYSGMINAAVSGTLNGTIASVDIEDIKGVLAQDALEGLDFSTTGKWALMNEDTPQLRAFADEAKLLSGDFSWYSADSNEYIINTAEELIGFSTLASSGTTYSGKTIKLGDNIDLNEGWTASANAEAPEVEWTPVGTVDVPFEGTFNGQGKSISGVYVASADNYIGLFGVAGESSEVNNLRLLNSYFEQQVMPENDTVELDGYVGSIAGWLQGDMDNVYSNAVVKSGNRYTGGLVSWVRRTDLSKSINITNCWYDGQIITGTYGRYIGGIAAGILNGTCNMENVLYTGTIDACYNGSKAIYLGGIVGEVKAITEELKLTSAVSAGQITGNNNGSVVHAVVGRVRTAVYDSGKENANATEPKLTLKNVFASRDCCQTAYSVASEVNGTKLVDGEEVAITSKAVVTGGVLLTSGDDRLIGCGTQEVTNEDGSALALDFAEAWSMRTNNVPIPTSLTDMAVKDTVIASLDATALAKEIGLDYWKASASITDAVAYGAGNYLVSYTLPEGKTYDGYIIELGKLGFEKHADNTGTGMATDGVVSGTYYKEATATTGEWVLNITSVAKESKIYISIGTDTKALDDNLQGATQDGDNAISLSMLEMVNTYGDDPDNNYDADPYGNSFVFQLPNGHFIISDGGREEDGLKLIEFLKNQAGTGNDVIIDAWIITHYHDDHCGALNMFSNDSSLREGIYLEAVYACEPSAYALDYWTAQLGVMNKALRGAMTLTKESDGTRPDVYQLHMGQRYYFNGITMDVIDTQEQHPVAKWGGENPDVFPDEFNTSSTNCVFTFTDKAGATKKVLIGGDATTVNMEYIIDVYGENNETLKDIDVFAAYHHGHNMTATYGDMTVSAKYTEYGITSDVSATAKGEANKNWINFLLNNNSDSKFDAVLFSYNQIYKMNVIKAGSLAAGTRYYYYKGTDNNVDYPYNIGEINDYLASSTCTDKAYTYENGTVKITFDGSNTTKVFGSGVFAE